MCTVNLCDICHEPAGTCKCAERMAWMADAMRGANFSMGQMGEQVENLQKAISMFGRSWSSANLQVGPPPSVHNRTPPQRSVHEHTIEQLMSGAVAQGVDEDTVRDAVRKVYAQAAMEDRANKWIESRVRSELKKLVQTDVHSLSYDEAEDTAVIGCDEFLNRVQPHERFASWNEAAAATAVHFGSMREEVESIRNLGYAPTITVYEVSDPGRGVVASERDSHTVVCCALAGVDVRFRIKVNQPMRMKEAVDKAKLGDMLKHGLEKRKGRTDEAILQALQNSKKKGR